MEVIQDLTAGTISGNVKADFIAYFPSYFFFFVFFFSCLSFVIHSTSCRNSILRENYTVHIY